MIDHAVLLKGYGKDDIAGRYWLIQNSWGWTWGEQGHIRLGWNNANGNPDGLDDTCGTDQDTSMGMACDGDAPTAQVCGACGVLFDPVFPTGVRIEHTLREMV